MDVNWDRTSLGDAVAELGEEDFGLPMAMVAEAWRLAAADGFEVIGQRQFRGYLAAAVEKYTSIDLVLDGSF